MLEGTFSPERSDCGGRIRNPYYDEWKKVEQESKRLDFSYRRSSDALFDVSLSKEEHDVYFDELKEINAWVEAYIHKYAWAIPNDDALLEIAKYSPLIEVGAGTGYWAWLLRQLGVDILAFDKYPPSQNSTSKSEFHPDADTWTEVLEGDESVLDSIIDRTLFLCLSCLSWKWRKRSSVKITERTYEEAKEALHAGREGRHSEEAFGGRSADLGSV